MERLKDLLDRKWAVAAAGLVLGLILGVLYAWVIVPVRWVDSLPAQLRSDIRVDYLRMVIDSYSVNRDVDLAMARYQALGPAADETLKLVGAEPGEVNPTAIQNFRAVVEIFQSGTPAAAQTTSTSGGGTVAGLGSTASRFILPVCGATLLLGVLLAGALVLRGRMGARSARPVRPQPTPASPVTERGRTTPSAPAPTLATHEPLATFRTLYSLGDDLYDDSFSIESPAGDFLGECGVGIGDLVGVGEPKKVSAFEIWLFDKNDIQTVTKVLMSRYAFNDEAVRSRLAAKGDPVQAASGSVITLQTASLEVEARIVDLKYGSGPLPPESFFERLTIELKARPGSRGV